MLPCCYCQAKSASVVALGLCRHSFHICSKGARPGPYACAAQPCWRLVPFFFVGFGRGGHCGVRTIRSVYYNLICTYLHFVRWISFSAWREKVETGTRSKNAVPFCMFEILFPHLLILHFSVCKQTHTQILGSAFTLSGLRNPSQRSFRSMLAIFLQLQNMEITSLQNHDMFHHVKQSWRKVLPVFGPTVDIP